jgi:hypothetical protein
MNQLIMKNSGGKRQRAEVVASPRTASWARFHMKERGECHSRARSAS